jgi:ATP phosphoribosyltransferase regulatory subunit
MKYATQEEGVINSLIALYESRGYKKYKPSCFEEYALYLENRDFLISKNVIAFSDACGKLQALIPDVTLSLIKHCKREDGQTLKLYYNEKVYRQLAGGSEYKEISQTGVEIVGDIDDVSQAELCVLIAETLNTISCDYLIDISHMGFVQGLIEDCNLDDKSSSYLYDLLKNKNIHDFEEFAEQNNLSKKQIESFKTIATISGKASTVIKQVKNVALNAAMDKAISQLENILNLVENLGYGDKFNINFSIANNADYYNGIIFNGYLDGVPHAVLSGGRYDNLVAKFNKQGGAIGFALYLGELERYFKIKRYAVNCIILYDDESSLKALQLSNKKLEQGITIKLCRSKPSDIIYDEVIDLREGKKV